MSYQHCHPLHSQMSYADRDCAEMLDANNEDANGRLPHEAGYIGHLVGRHTPAVELDRNRGASPAVQGRVSPPFAGARRTA